MPFVQRINGVRANSLHPVFVDKNFYAAFFYANSPCYFNLSLRRFLNKKNYACSAHL